MNMIRIMNAIMKSRLASARLRWLPGRLPSCLRRWLAGWPRHRPPCLRKNMNMNTHLDRMRYARICYDMIRHHHEYENAYEYEYAYEYESPI